MEVVYNDAVGGEPDETAPEPPFRRVRKDGQGYRLEFGFLSFREDRLAIRFELPMAEVEKGAGDVGYTDAQVEALDVSYERAQEEAITQARKTGSSRLGLDKQLQDIERQYKSRRRIFFEASGFKLLPGNVVAADIPRLVHKNTNRLHPLASEFSILGRERGYEPEDIVGAATAMVQTAIEYKIPPNIAGARHTGGVLPPMTALTQGWGDCDTKTAVLASIMANWDLWKAVGVGLPGHYLMGIQAIPDKGEAFVEYDGATYVLIEPAGPAWSPPGQVSDTTLAKLELADGVTIEPF